MAGALRVFLAVLALLAAATGTGVGTAPSAAAVDHSRGRPGFCPNANGVTVVVDFRELGGKTIVRCAVGSQQTGLAALKEAGFKVTGTNRWGESFICRLENKPGPDSEPCIDTPPASAYWSYWHAPNGGGWTYSQYGATYRTPPTGSFEGWSFSSNRDQSDAPAPRVTPRRPASGGSNGGSGNGGSGGGGTGGGSTGGSGGGGSTGGGGDQGGAYGGGGANGSVGGPGSDGGPSGSGEKGAVGGTDRDGKQPGPNGGPSGSKPGTSPSGSGPGSDPGSAPGPVVTPTEDADWTDGEDRADEAAESGGVPTGTVVWAAFAAALAVGSGLLSWRRRRTAAHAEAGASPDGAAAAPDAPDADQPDPDNPADPGR